MPKAFQTDTRGKVKLSLTLTDAASDQMRRLADAEDITLAELVRRSVGLYSYYASLDENEELCVRSKPSGEISRLHIM